MRAGAFFFYARSVEGEAKGKRTGGRANRDGRLTWQGGKLRVAASQRTGQDLAAGGAKSCTIRANVLQLPLRGLLSLELLRQGK